MGSSAFPLPWEHVRWRSRRLGMSNFRVVALRSGKVSAEMALHDVASIEVESSHLERLTGGGTLVVRPARRTDAPLRIASVVRAQQKAL